MSANPIETHVLLVDRDDGPALALQRELALLGYRVSLVGSAQEAVSLLATEPATVVVLDCLEPDAVSLSELTRSATAARTTCLLLLAPGNSRGIRARKFAFERGAQNITAHTITSLVDAIAAIRTGEPRLDQNMAIGNTVLLSDENRLRTDACEIALKPAAANLLVALIGRYPRLLTHEEILTEVVHFSREAKTGAVYNRIYELRRALRCVGANVSVDRISTKGYRLVVHEEQQRRVAEKEVTTRGVVRRRREK